jgi:class 3 adenylate cyclase
MTLNGVLMALGIVFAVAFCAAIAWAYLLRHTRADLRGHWRHTRANDPAGAAPAPPQARREAAERVLTLMFVDIVGFSRSVEIQPPREAFSQLREIIHWLTATVTRFGGVVDRTLGDGMLCVFGADGPTEDSSAHAEAAVACAVEIQRKHLEHAIASLNQQGARVFPLRIGINTAAVYVGDLGQRGASDLTVIGSGVNLAQRLESACETYRVLLGPTTHSLLRQADQKAALMRKRLVPLKHHREPLEAFEIDPFPNDDHDVARVLAAHWDSLGRERMEERWLIPEGVVLRVETQYGPGELLNFSLNGLGLRLHEYLGRQLPLSISLGHEQPLLRTRLHRAGVEEVVGEVRWARPLERGFVHGILIKNLSQGQRQELLARLLHWLRASEKQAVG